MTKSQNQLPQWSEAIQKGKDWILGNTSDKPSLKDALPAIATSDTADAFLISAWGIYHGFGAITAIRKSRGYSWKVEFRSCHTFIVEVSNPHDHRDGIKIVSEYIPA